MYAPNRQKIFEDIEISSECCETGCQSYRAGAGTRNMPEKCMATSHGECARVNQISSEVNQFISDNDDVFMYIQPIGE